MPIRPPSLCPPQRPHTGRLVAHGRRKGHRRRIFAGAVRAGSDPTPAQDGAGGRDRSASRWLRRLASMRPVLLIVAVSGVSFSGPLIAATAAPALAIAFWRNALRRGASRCRSMLARRRRGVARARPDGRSGPLPWPGVALSLHFATWVPSVTMTSVASATALVATQSIFVARHRPCAGSAVAATGLDRYRGVDRGRGAGHRGRHRSVGPGPGRRSARRSSAGSSPRSTSRSARASGRRWATSVYTSICYSVCAVVLLVACASSVGCVAGGSAPTPGSRSRWSRSAPSYRDTA